MPQSRLRPLLVTLQESPATGVPTGWYAADEDHVIELGPFDTQEEAQRECDDASAQSIIKETQSPQPEVFVVYADVPGVEGGPIVLPGFEASDADAARTVMRRSEGEFRLELEAHNLPRPASGRDRAPLGQCG